MAASDSDLLLKAGVLMASGAAALGHEILWTRRLIDLLGASAESSARVFECFFLGLSLGAAVAALALPRIRRHWHFVGWVELGIAVLCVPAVLLPAWTGWVWPALGAERLVSWQGSALKLAFSVLVILPPTFLMGMTLPVLASAHAGGGGRIGRPNREILLYAANTLGGVIGLAVVVLFALRALGCAGAMLLMMALNVGVAALCFRRGFRQPAPAAVVRPEGAEPRLVHRNLDWGPVLFAFFSGAGILGLEVLALALANLSAPLSIYPQSSILIAVILVLALAAFLVARVELSPERAVDWLRHACATSCLAVTLIPAVFLALPGVRGGLFGYGQTFGQFLSTLVGNVLLALGPAILATGLVFPLTVIWGRRAAEIPGRTMARLLAANGLGGIVGAEFAYRVLLPQFAVHVSTGIVGLAYGLAAVALLLARRERRLGAYTFPLIAVLAAGILTKTVLAQLPVYYQDKVYRVADLQVGREGSLAIVEDGRSRVMIFDNQYTLGGTWATHNLRRQSHLPLLFHPNPRRVGYIGLGTGITASGALEHSAVESVTIVELSRLVHAAAESHFGSFNHQVCQSSRASIHVEDARIYLESSEDSFDVLVGDLFTPWRPGEASLSSLEQFQAAKTALSKGGVFCQWIELTQWTPAQLEMAAATFRQVFGHLYLVRAGFQTGSVPVGLLGFADGVPDWETVRRRCSQEMAHGRLTDPLCRHVEGVAMLFLGEVAPSSRAGSQLNTLNNLRIELEASAQVVLSEGSQHFDGSGSAWLGLLDRQTSALLGGRTMPPELSRLPALGVLATRLEVALGAGDGTSESLASHIAAEVPAVIRDDGRSDWTLWPGTVIPWRLGDGPVQRQSVTPGAAR